MLEVRDLYVYYGLIEAVKGIDFEIKEAKITSLIGSNGAGKTSTLLALLSMVKKKGEILNNGFSISKLSTSDIVKRGIVLVPEGRRVFINLSVEENLRIGAFNNDENYHSLLHNMYEMFPRLKLKRKQLSGTMSGGEQQMLAIARALMSEPKVLMLDEPSLGLSPKLTGEVFETIQKLNSEGMTIFLVEQNAYAALKIADYAYVLENGKITHKDSASNMINSDLIRKKYLGG